VSAVTGLRIRCPQGRGRSSLPPGMKWIAHLARRWPPRTRPPAGSVSPKCPRSDFGGAFRTRRSGGVHALAAKRADRQGRASLGQRRRAVRWSSPSLFARLVVPLRLRQLLHIVRRELRPVDRQRQLVERAGEREWHLVIVGHRRAGVGANV